MRRRDPEGSRRAIIGATLAILRTRGIHELTTDRIAKQAACAKGLVNYHFQSRETLLEAAITAAASQLLDPRVEATKTAGAGLVGRSWDVVAAQAADGSMLMWAGVQSLSANPELGAALRATRADIQQRWQDAIEAWLDRSGFADGTAGEVARAGWAMLDGFGFALLHEDPDVLYPSYLTAWLGLIGELGRASTSDRPNL